MVHDCAVIIRKAKSVASAAVGNRRWLRGYLEELGPAFAGKRVLEIGSGKPVDGAYPYSMVELFPTAGEFVMSDIEANFGHSVVDLTNVQFRDEFDLLLCISVLEHIPDVRSAVDGIHTLLKPGGTAFVAVPFAYPLHDEPHDYWRFTEHGLRNLFEGFDNVRVGHRGLRKLPTGLLLTATSAD